MGAALAAEPDVAATEAEALALQETPEGRRFLTRLGNGDGLTFYADHYLGLATPECHVRWFRAFDLTRRLLFLAPRSHGKTSSAARVFIGQRILTNRNVRILVVSLTKGAAAKSARQVRRDLEKNPRIREDWTCEEAGGPFREKGAPWTDSFFYVRRSQLLRDPTVEAVGAGGAITGGRFDVIIIDDPEDERTTLTARRRRKTVEWLYGTVLPLLDTGGQVVVIGTRKHAADLFDTIDKDPTFAKVCDRAIEAWPDLEKVRWIHRTDPETGRQQLVDVEIPPEAGGKVLWPEKLSLGALLLIWKSNGSLLFTREYQNDVIDDAAAAFRKDWLAAAKKRGAGRGFLKSGWDFENDVPHPRCEGLIVWQSWDFALVDSEEKAEEQDSDYTVGQTWGLDWETGDRVLLRAIRRRGLSPQQILALVESEAALFPQRIAVIVENNSFGKILEMGLRRSTDLPLYGHTTDKKKHSLFEGVPAMSAGYENGKVILPYAGAGELADGEADPRPFVDLFVAEHHGLGREAHDDTVMGEWVGHHWIVKWIRAEEVRRRKRRVRVSGGAKAA